MSIKLTLILHLRDLACDWQAQSTGEVLFLTAACIGGLRLKAERSQRGSMVRQMKESEDDMQRR